MEGKGPTLYCHKDQAPCNSPLSIPGTLKFQVKTEGVFGPLLKNTANPQIPGLKDFPNQTEKGTSNKAYVPLQNLLQNT